MGTLTSKEAHARSQAERHGHTHKQKGTGTQAERHRHTHNLKNSHCTGAG